MLGSAGETIISAEKLAEWLYEEFVWVDACEWRDARTDVKNTWRDRARRALIASAVEL